MVDCLGGGCGIPGGLCHQQVAGRGQSWSQNDQKVNGTKLEQMQGKDKTAFVKSEETKDKFIRNRLYLFDQCADPCLIEIIHTHKHANNPCRHFGQKE